MPDKDPLLTEVIPCEICLTEIPNSVIFNAEFDAYVSNYCGLDCYEQWREKQIANANSNKTN